MIIKNLGRLNKITRNKYVSNVHEIFSASSLLSLSYKICAYIILYKEKSFIFLRDIRITRTNRECNITDYGFTTWNVELTRTQQGPII